MEDGPGEPLPCSMMLVELDSLGPASAGVVTPVVGVPLPIAYRFRIIRLFFVAVELASFETIPGGSPSGVCGGTFASDPSFGSDSGTQPRGPVGGPW